MALSASTVWEVRQTGNDTNGGGYVSGGTDWSQQDSPQYSVTDGVTAGTTTITSATANFGTDVVGNIMYVQGGTGSVAANWYQITSRTNATTIVVDRSTGLTAGTGVTLKIGGAFATPGVFTSVSGGVGGQLVSGMKAWVKYNATAMSCSTSTAGPAGPCQIPSGVAFVLEGYDATRGDRTGNRPTYKWTVSPGSLTYAIKAIGSAKQAVANMAVDGNAQSNAGGIDCAATRTGGIDCYVANCSAAGAIGILGSSGTLVKCKAYNCITGISGGYCFNCDVDCASLASSTSFSAASAASHCLARNATTGFSGALGQALVNCTADTCGTGYTTSSASSYTNCLASNCTTAGYSVSTNIIHMTKCAYYNNVTNISGTPLLNEGAISLSADPYVNQAGADFRPNSTAGGGAAIQAAGIGVYGQTDNVDVGAVQHGDAGPFFGYIAMP